MVAEEYCWAITQAAGIYPAKYAEFIQIASPPPFKTKLSILVE